MSKFQCSPILYLLVLFCTPTIAQHSITGKVVDRQQQPISYANVILFNAQDSTTVVKGAVTSEEGLYEFLDIAPSEYVLQVSFVGYENYINRIEVTADAQLDPISLSEMAASLDEIAITVKNPSINREVDRLVFNVENSSLSSGTTWDILKKTPMVIVSNGNLQVRNQGVEIYINDRKVHLTASELQQLLESYSGENIKSVEVITNPPSRYDAEGGSILNIITSKGISTGYKGNLNGSYTQATFPKYSYGTGHYLKTDKLNLFANYSFSPRKEYKNDDSYINFRNDLGVEERWETDFTRITRSKAHNANLMLDYFLSDRNTLSLSANALLSPGKTFENEVQTARYNRLGQLDSRFTTSSGLEEDMSNAALDLQFKHQLKKEGAEVVAKAHFTRYDQDRMQDVDTDYFTPEGQLSNSNAFHTFALQTINIATAQLGYSTPWGSSSFETGIKASLIDSESGIDYFNEDNSLNQELSDNFLYDEKVYAAYASLSRDWEKWSLKAGLRGEYTDREGDSRSMDEVNRVEDFELFPTLYLMYSLNENHSFSFDYSRRIQRPRYERLNPFRYFLNEHSYNSGNPDLKAAVSDNFNFNYTLQGQYFFDIYYRNNGPASEVFGFQDNQNRTLRNVSINLEESLSYGLDFSHGRAIASWWYAYTYMSFFHDEQTFLALEDGNVEATNAIDGYYGTLGNSFTLSQDGSFTGDLSLTYISDWISGSYNLDPMTTLSLGLRKTLWNNRAELSLHVEDLLNKTNTRLTSRYLNQDNSFLAQPESRYVRLGFKYNFGNFRLSDNQRAIEAAERDRL